MPSGAELFVDATRRLGIDTIFTLVGDHLNEVLIEAGRAGMRIIDMRHESGVTHAADAWARLRRAPALSLVTGGPGHTNSLTGIATAFLATSPLIAVSGAPSTMMRERVVFQDINQAGMAAPVVKWSAEPPSTAQIPFYLGRAYATAMDGRMGPVHLTIPVNLFAGNADAAVPMPLPAAPSPAAPSSTDVERALDLLRKAERPVIIAGSGVWWADATKEMRDFVKRTRIPYYNITLARGILSDLDPANLGYADPALNRATHTIFKEADVFLVLGKRLDYRLAMAGPRLFSPAAKFIQVDIHAPELGGNRALELGLCADVKATLRALLSAAGREHWKAKPWVKRCRVLKEQCTSQLDALAEDRGSPLHPAAFYSEYRKHLPGEPLYAWDGGDFTHWGRAMVPVTRPGAWLRLGPMGTIGSALPNAIAMQLAHPDERVVMITGDGSLGFYLAELDTAVRHRLPIIIIVGNDGGWGLERELQAEMNGGGATVACELRRTRYDIIMQGFGGDGETIDRPEQVGPALKRAFASKVPYLINVDIRGVRSPFTEWQVAGKAKR